MKTSYQELMVQNQIIRGLLVEADNAKELVVMLHGFTGHKNENSFLFKQIADCLQKNGFSSIRFDYRGSGDSDGDFTEQSFLTAYEDAQTVIDYAFKINNNKPIILLGFSMGGALASRVSLENQDKISKLILMSPAANMFNILNNIFKNNPLIDNRYVDLGGYYIDKNYRDSLENYDFYKGTDGFTHPVLITQGLADLAVIPSFSKRYMDFYPHAEYYSVNEATHCYNKCVLREKLYKKIIEFINK